jgi:predicted dehydrogenase
MPHPVRVAIDGCGALTTETILPHLIQPDFTAKAKLVAVCDIVPERAQDAAAKFDVPHAFGSLDQMLAGPEFDVLLIIVPHRLHAEHALKALRADKHVYIQKPMAPSVAEGAAVLQEARARGRKLVAAPGQPLWPLYDAIKKVIEDGQIGEPFFAVPPLLGWGGRHVQFPNDPSWFFSEHGGPLRDHGGYGIQTLTTLFGPAKRVTGLSGNVVKERTWNGAPFECTGHDNSVGLLDFGRSFFGVFPESWSDSGPASRVMRIQGLTGTIETSVLSCNDLTIFPYAATVRRMWKSPLYLSVKVQDIPCMAGIHEELGHVHVYSDILHLVDCVLENREPKATGEQALHTVEIINAVFQSAESGQVQNLETSF